MTTTTAPALPPGQPLRRKRVLFGLLDADGWTWATVKALFWFVVIIMVLGYLPDRAYYFTVFSTIDLGLNVVSPVNICPTTNANLPCPVPIGAIVPWEAAPTQLYLPAARTDGAAVQSGSTILFVGGSDGTKAQSSVYVTTVASDGSLSPWRNGTALPAARSQAQAAFLSGAIFVVGGIDDSGKATDTVYVGIPDQKTGQVTSWKTGPALPAPRAAATVVPLSDGLLVLGGDDASGKPTSTVWKATVDASGNLGAWQPDGSIGDGAHTYPRAWAGGVLQGKFLFLFGGSDAAGATRQVLRASVGSDASGHQVVTSPWAVPTNDSANLPAPRTHASTFTANGALYLVGGSDGSHPQSQLYWTVPDASGAIASWSSLTQTDLPAGLGGLEGAAALLAGPFAYLFGGTTGSGTTPGVARADLDPKPPLLQVGLLGATIPAMGIQGEVGQQLGYLAAAGVGTINFIILILIGLALTHPERTRELWDQMRSRRRRRSSV